MFNGRSPEQILESGDTEKMRDVLDPHRHRVWNIQLTVYRLHRDTPQPFEYTINKENRRNPARIPMLYCAAVLSGSARPHRLGPHP
jgi:hypothetical protein